MSYNITRSDLNHQDFDLTLTDNETTMFITPLGIIEMLFKVYKMEDEAI